MNIRFGLVNIQGIIAPAVLGIGLLLSFSPLQAGELVFQQEFKGMKAPEAIFPSPFTEEIISKVEDAEFALGEEFLFAVNLADSPYAPQGEGRMTDILNDFLRIQQMEGLEYTSAARNKTVILINSSYRIASKDNDEPLEDLQVDAYSGPIRVESKLNMADFGDIYWDITYRMEDNFINISLVNTTKLVFGALWKVAEPGEFTLDLIVKVEERLAEAFFVGLLDSDSLGFLNFIGLGNYMERTFHNRLYAIGNFYANK
ncbi:MAG: hypothetical protein K9L75_02600 [Spirochaetia bacterium]|nr:hypothetical protein [Spirochaetia bacterium]